MRGNRPRRQALGQLQQEAPIAAPPAEQRQASSSVGVKQIVLALRDGWQQIGPLPGDRQRRVVVELEISDGVPGGSSGLTAARPVSRSGKLERLSLALSHQKDPLALLRSAMIGGVEDLEAEAVSGLGFAIDAIDRTAQQIQAFRLVLVGQPRHVLQQKGARLGFLEHPQVAQRRGARIVQASRVAAGPVTGFAERLAGRTADQQVRVAGLQAGRRQDLAGGNRVDVPLDDRPVAVVAERPAGVPVELDRYARLEAGGFQPKVQPAGSREQTDDRRFSHAMLSTRPWLLR